jgi:mannan endo-1,4-beta-mannosidase
MTHTRHTLHRLSFVLALDLLLFLVLVPSRANAADSMLLGVYYGNQGWKMDQVRALERWQQKPHATILLFTNFCNRQQVMDNLFGQQLPNIWNNHNVPIVTWELYLCSSSTTPKDIEVRVARGDYDSYIATWVGRLKTWLSGLDGMYGNDDDRRAYLRLGHEMNGDWYPWSAASGNNSPSDYIAMWHRVRNIFAAQGLEHTRLQWIWAVNNMDVGRFAAEQYYPGDAAVDWVAIDGYNWGYSQSWSTWQSPSTVFGPMLARLREFTAKPLALTETASTTATANGMSIATKSQWIADFFSYTIAQNVRMAIWFNVDKETDWAVFGGSNGDAMYQDGRTKYKVYSAYKTAISSPTIIGSTSAATRLLTDAQFVGQ